MLLLVFLLYYDRPLWLHLNAGILRYWLACERQFAEMRNIFVAYDHDHSGELNRLRFTQAFEAAGVLPGHLLGWPLNWLARRTVHVYLTQSPSCLTDSRV